MATAPLPPPDTQCKREAWQPRRHRSTPFKRKAVPLQKQGPKGPPLETKNRRSDAAQQPTTNKPLSGVGKVWVQKGACKRAATAFLGQTHRVSDRLHIFSGHKRKRRHHFAATEHGVLGVALPCHGCPTQTNVYHAFSR